MVLDLTTFGISNWMVVPNQRVPRHCPCDAASLGRYETLMCQGEYVEDEDRRFN